MAQLRIGTSGWSYPGWNDRFYPADLPRRAVLAYNAARFNSVEINGSFYALQTPATYRKWYDATPRGFVFAVKGSRFITHNKKLLNVESALANFFASGLLLLKEKLGPIVWQLPASARFDADRLSAFFDRLPRNTNAAAALARRHDARVDGRCWTEPPASLRRIRHAVEVRNSTFFVGDFVRLARRHRIAVVVSDAPSWPRVEELTADFVYVRLHGATRTYASAYGDRELDEWAARIAAWRAGRECADMRRITKWASPRRRERDVYVYFDNDYEANAPNDALRLAARLAAFERPRQRSGGEEDARRRRAGSAGSK